MLSIYNFLKDSMYPNMPNSPNMPNTLYMPNSPNMSNSPNTPHSPNMFNTPNMPHSPNMPIFNQFSISTKSSFQTILHSRDLGTNSPSFLFCERGGSPDFPYKLDGKHKS